jgi:hypothetical protein
MSVLTLGHSSQGVGDATLDTFQREDHFGLLATVVVDYSRARSIGHYLFSLDPVAERLAGYTSTRPDDP